MLQTNAKIGFIVLLLLVLTFGGNQKSVFAQETASVLYVPLIGITSVPEPLALPTGAGNVTYHYAVKNFLSEVALTAINVLDDKCNPVIFVEGDDNHNAMLEYSETWRYTCTTKLSRTTQSTATATGTANNISAIHKAYATVVVGSNTPPPLISIVNITKVAYPLSLPSGGGNITFTYKVNNPGIVPLRDIAVTDDKCRTMSGKLGDTNGNNLLDTTEVWIYTCTTILTQTTTNTANVTAFANGLKAVGEATLTVVVDAPLTESHPTFPETGTNPDFKILVWKILAAILTTLIIIFLLKRIKKQ